MNYHVSTISFEAADGFELAACVYTPLAKTANNKVLLIGSAFGVPYQYYKHFAGYMAEQGITVVSFDYRGISHSQQGNMPTEEILMQHWGELDLEAAIQFIKRTYSPEQLFYMGHSAGGQIIGLAPSSLEFDKVIIAASGVGSWRLWPGLQKYGLAAIWYLVFPVVMSVQFGDFFKSRFLGPTPVPKNAVKQWLRWARSREYLFTPEHGIDTQGYHNIDTDILALTISDDWYAPSQARDGLLKHYPKCKQTILNITPASIGVKKIGHFGLFKKKQEIEQGIWQPIVNFLNQKEGL